MARERGPKETCPNEGKRKNGRGTGTYYNLALGQENKYLYITQISWRLSTFHLSTGW